MEPARIITKARANLIFEQPFFGAVALRLEMAPTADLQPPTLSVDGYKIYYHPDYVQKIGEDLTTTAIAHEVLHVTCLHHTRLGNRNPLIWNFACDYAINPILMRNGFPLKQNDANGEGGWLYDTKYENMHAEKIYNNLMKDPKIQEILKQQKELGEAMEAVAEALGNQNGNGKQKPVGNILKPPKAKKEIAETDAKTLTNTGIAAAKQAGSIPGGMQELIDANHEPQVNWKERLRELLQPRALGDQVWHRPYKRMLDTIYLPHFEKKPTGKLIWAIDTSGSVSNKELQVYASELQAIMLDNHIEKATMLHIDTKVQKVEEFGPDDELNFNVYGRGGTYFEPAFNWVEENLQGELPDALLYFTDGEASFPQDPPPYPVIWCISGKITAPWGDTIELRF